MKGKLLRAAAMGLLGPLLSLLVLGGPAEATTYNFPITAFGYEVSPRYVYGDIPATVYGTIGLSITGPFPLSCPADVHCTYAVGGTAIATTGLAFWSLHAKIVNETQNDFGCFNNCIGSPGFGIFNGGFGIDDQHRLLDIDFANFIVFNSGYTDTPPQVAIFISLPDGLTLSPTAPTPLPAALPLFATGLGVLGLLGWRRKRKQAA